MRLVEIFRLGNDIEGTFVQVGFGKGRTTKLVFDAMNNSTLTKRDSVIIDSFKGANLPTPVDLQYYPDLTEGQKPGRLQVAMDMRYYLGNDHSVAILKQYVSKHLSSTYKSGPIACLHIDLPSYSATVKALDILQVFLNRDAIVYISGYGDSIGVTRAVDDYIEDNSIQYQFFTYGQQTKYLKNKIAPVFFTGKSFSRPTLQTDEAIPVSRPKVVPFADRYIKPIIEKFKPKKDILSNVDEIVTNVSKDDNVTPEETIPVSKTKVTPFADRYTKVENKVFKPKQVITEGLDVIDKKVSR